MSAVGVWRGPVLSEALNRTAVRLLRTLAPRVLWAVPTSERVVALTIDDGPHPVTTPLLLDLLAAHGAHATFFLIGDQVAGNKSILERIAAEGHELGNHTMTAVPSITLAAPAFSRDLVTVGELLRPFGPVRYARPASGWFTPAMLRVAAEHGYQIALGGVTTTDTDSRRPEASAGCLSRRVYPGSIVVLHEGSTSRAGVVEVTRLLLSDLQERGYAMVTLSELARRG